MQTTSKTFEAAKGSLLGDRARNQDRCLFLSNPETALLCLADGLGGHPRGEVAAQLLLDVAEVLFRQTSKPLVDPERFMLRCIGKAHHAILRFGSRQTPPIAPRSTAVIAIVQDGIAYWCHVGDSRLYLIRNRQVQVQTRDHAEVRYVRQSETETSRPRASLTRCLGGLPQPPTTTCGVPTQLRHGDALLLCSDGLWGQVPKQALIDAFDPGESGMQDRLQTLLKLATTVPNSDNASAVAMRWLPHEGHGTDHPTPPEAAADPRPAPANEHLDDVLKDAGEGSLN